MQVEENEGGGKSVILEAGDSLDKVPKSHRDLITPQLRETFSDPPSYFRQIADECSFPAMAAWLRILIEEENWELVLHRGDPEEWTSAGIRWWSEKVRSAEITPACAVVPPGLPPTLGRYYSLVDEVSWMPFGCAGGLDGSSSHTPLTDFCFEYQGAEIDPAKTFVLGWSPCGDMLIYTDDGRGGWLAHETAEIQLLGTIEETIEWVYLELQADRCPDFDYN
jgi:hypothetical protein